MMSSDMARMLAEAFCRTDLPTTFNPDAGISFTRPISGTWPTGTKLFTVAEATAMFEDILKFLPVDEKTENDKATAAEESAQAYRLVRLAEECAEVIHAATKILRHGPDNHHPDHKDLSNRQHLEAEVDDLLAVLEGMRAAGDIKTDATARTTGNRREQ